MDILNRPDDMIRITTPELAEQYIAEQVKIIKEQVGDKKVLLALPEVLIHPSSQHSSSRRSAISWSAFTSITVSSERESRSRSSRSSATR